jgi:hypothetical protein
MQQLVEEKFNLLPENLKIQVVDFINFLLTKNKIKKAKNPPAKFNFSWEGGLSELKNEYSSVELQHKAMEWR